jgi:hypothetical protein
MSSSLAMSIGFNAVVYRRYCDISPDCRGLYEDWTLERMSWTFIFNVKIWMPIPLMLGCGEPRKSSWKDYCRRSTAVRQDSHILECWLAVFLLCSFTMKTLLRGLAVLRCRAWIWWYSRQRGSCWTEGEPLATGYLFWTLWLLGCHLHSLLLIMARGGRLSL